MGVPDGGDPQIPSLVMIARYRRQAQTVQELNLGWLKPLHEVVPELAAMDGSEGNRR